MGGTLWAGAAGLLAVAARRVEREPDPRPVPLMGVLGAFAFAARMVNFSIPGTGSSGHLGGGLLLAALLGPSAGFLVRASVLTVQALLFADGGLLALGAKLLNMGFASCFLACSLVFRPLAGSRGANGAGKSTVLLLLAGVIFPERGSVRVGDWPVTPATLPHVRRALGMVFQDPDDQLFLPTVEGDVAFGPANLGLPPEEVRERAEAALTRVGALHLRRHPTGSLAGRSGRWPSPPCWSCARTSW
ncbi:MAG TPA: energy-coupling factor ABC transporter permease [Anaeromyxobacter sp.]|nr:energy-coupling factor ABC transporter permease [Anaeromyxobacter sp.]